jgi:hypothetical protein
MVVFGLHFTFTKCNNKVQPHFYIQATQLLRMSNKAAFRLHESRNEGPGVLETFVHVRNNFSIMNLFVQSERLCKIS